MKAYLILTESGKRLDANTLARADVAFGQGYMVLHGLGYWQGKREKTLVLLVTGYTLARVKVFCKSAKRANRQQAILVLGLGSEVFFI
jgi:hypothetical protein